MMRTLPLAVSTALFTGSLLLVASSAGATTLHPTNSACVTKAELHAVRDGMTRAHVARIFGTDGHLVLRVVDSGHVYTEREYPACGELSLISLSYLDSRVTSR